MSRQSGRDYSSLIPEILDAASLPGNLGWITGSKRRRSHDAHQDVVKKAKEEISEISPLLQLPAELRIRIFEYVLGGNTVHIEQLPWGHVDKYEKKDISFGQGLWNEICHVPDQEHDSYTTFKNTSMLETNTPFGMRKNGEDIGTGYHVESWSARHSGCSQEPQLFQFNANLERWLSRKRLDLSALRTCKRVYRECHLLPYTGNTFLFRSPSTFQAFASNIGTENVQALQYISIPVAVGSAPFSPARSRAWASTLWDYNLTHRFSNLRGLRITLELYFPRDHAMGMRKPTYVDCREEVGLSGEGHKEQYTDWLQQLSKLRPCEAEISASKLPRVREPVKKLRFKVMVADDPLSMWGPVGQIQYCRDNGIRNVSTWIREREGKCLTVEQKQQLAGDLEGRLYGEASSIR